MKKRYLFIVLMASVSCGQHGQQEVAAQKDSAAAAVVITNDTIPGIRTSIKKQPVASFSEAVGDELNDWKFAVQVYETQRTFHFRLNIQYKELRITDSVNIPDFGSWPKVALRQGEGVSCIIGFLDTKGDFREYKKVSVNNEQLRFTTIRRYYVSANRTLRNG